MRRVSPDLVTRPLDVAQDALRALEQPLPAFGQPHPAVGAREQGDVELVLEPLDMPGEGGLSDMQMSRGAGDAAELGDANEIVKAAQFHRIRISPTGRSRRQSEFLIFA
jgi:hypothetical protein